MPEFFAEHPGRLYVVATLLPLFPAALILLVGTVRNLTRPSANDGGAAGWVYARLNRPWVDLAGAWLSVATIATAAILSFPGLFRALTHDEHRIYPGEEPGITYVAGPFAEKENIPWLRFGSTPRPSDSREEIYNNNSWVRSGYSSENPEKGTFDDLYIFYPTFWIGYLITPLGALMFSMISTVATSIFVFSIGYMRQELHISFTDHELHIKRRGRFGRYFFLLNMFVVAMLSLIIAGDLLHIFVSWELVGVCSFFLIGFYTERPTAGWAANKAFIVNRMGDVGFLVAMAALWNSVGSLHLFAIADGDTTFGILREDSGRMTMLIIGLGLFLGCVGKSAQFPLQVWLPDAMAGPTPVSALIHAATMVAAGVYLVARCYPLFTPDVLLVIAYTGCITLFIAATVACVQTDIKKVLAYSTVSQLGFMMLALGVGGWAAGVFHLLTHAFFKALLFLAAGSVIHGLHHEQDLRRMGGLYRKMPITALTMLVGVLAISGFPLLSGWYSKEAVLTAAATFGVAEPSHAILAVVPFLTAGLTAFYMFRLWFLTFAGEPRDRHVYDHAHESPLVMTVPLIVLAMFSIVVGWGWPAWEPEASFLYQLLNVQGWYSSHFWDDPQSPLSNAATLLHDYHLLLEAAAGAIGLLGFTVAYWLYIHRTPTFAPDSGHSRSRLAGFFANGWYFDAVYDAVIRKPTQRLAFLAAAADKQTEPETRPTVHRPLPTSLDGLLNGVGRVATASGRGLRSLQTGRIRGYVAILGLTVVGVLGMLAILTR